VGRYQAGAVSGASFAVACLASVAGGPWSRFTPIGWAYVAGAVLGVLVAFIAATVMHGRRGGSGGMTRALASVAFGWAAAIAVVIFAVASYVLVVIALLVLSGAPVTG
jgi:hypothetical protein